MISFPFQAEETRFSAWQAAIQQGNDQLNRGEGVTYTSDTLKDITQTAIDAMHSGLLINRDILL